MVEPSAADAELLSLREACLKPGWFCDSDHPAVLAYAARVCQGAEDDRARAVRLFRAVREEPRYDPYAVSGDARTLRASAVLGQPGAYCIPKAVLLCALLRAVNIPARLGFADVKNHLASEKLLASLGSDLFAFHGYVEVWLGTKRFKVTPAFNASLCARFGVAPLEFDGESDALLQPFDGEGRPYMAYVRDRGLHLDLPFEEILSEFERLYGTKWTPRGTEAAGGDVGAAADKPFDEAFHR